ASAIERAPAPIASDVGCDASPTKNLDRAPKDWWYPDKLQRDGAENHSCRRDVEGGIGHSRVRPVDHSGDPTVGHQDVLGMEVAVADDASLLRHRPMIEEPRHRVLQAAKVRAHDLAFETSEVTLEGHQPTVDRWPVRSVRLLAFPVERLEQHLRIEGMKP